MKSLKKYALICITIIAFIFTITKNNDDLPLIAIANLGPHSSIEDAITGFKEEMERKGFKENSNIRYITYDVGFNARQIPQMVESLKIKKPDIIVSITTPVTQTIKEKIKDIPIVYSIITDPVEAGIIRNYDKPYKNITGSSDYQNIEVLLNFVEQILPNIKTLGMFYSSSEINDHILIEEVKSRSKSKGIKLMSIPISDPKDIPIAMEKFRGNVDFIYVGGSGMIQPSVPVISSKAIEMKIPVFNIDSKTVEDGFVFASFGVSYKKVGINTAILASEILKGTDISNLTPLYPSTDDHSGFINLKIAKQLGINIPPNMPNVTYIGEK